MRVESPYYVFDIPDGFAEIATESCKSFVRAADGVEITVSTLISSDDNPPEYTLLALSEHHQLELSRTAALKPLTPRHFETLSEGAVHAMSFFAGGENPRLAFCAELTNSNQERGRRCIVSLSIYQHHINGQPPPDAQEFEYLARVVLLGVEPTLPPEA